MNIPLILDKTLRKYAPKVFNYKRDKYFKGDTSFYSLLNLSPDTLYQNLKHGNVEFIRHDKEKGRLYFKYKDTAIVCDYIVGNLIENFGKKVFKFPVDQIDRESIVFDLGTNKGFSTLYFAQNMDVKKVIGFEIDPKLITFVRENIEINPEMGKKIEINGYGLGDRNSEVEIYTTSDNDSVTTANKDFFENGWTEERKSNLKKYKAEIRKASEVIKEYISKFPNINYVLAIDIEGAEYEVIKDLYNNDLLKNFYLITGEFHNGYEGLKEYFKDFHMLDFEGKEKYNGLLGTFTLKRKF